MWVGPKLVCTRNQRKPLTRPRENLMSIIKNRKKSGTAALGAAAAAAPAVVIPLLLFGPGIDPAYADGMGPTPAPVPSPSRSEILMGFDQRAVDGFGPVIERS
jgi:hypothetical protein